jgi:putative component of toxin-antitoxin plasmid stabilization module
MNRRKNNNLKRPSGKKRKVIGTGVLIVNLIFGGLKTGSAKIQNHKAVTALDYERVISNQELTSSETSDNPEKIIQTGGGIIIAFRQKAHDSSLNEEFNSLEKNNGKVILAKAEGSNPLTPPTTRSGPSNFPTPPSGGTPSRPVSGLNPYRTAPRVIDTGLGGAGGNPGGGGGNGGDGYGNNGQEDVCPVPKEDIEQSFQGQGKYGVKTYQVKSQIGKHNKLKKISKKIRNNPKPVKEFARLKEKLQQGNLKAGKGTKYLPGSNGIYYARGATEGARIYFQYSGDNIITIIAESNKATQKEVINCLLKNY